VDCVGTGQGHAAIIGTVDGSAVVATAWPMPAP